MKRTHKGFTLVELLIVVAIVGILATMVSLTSGEGAAKARASQIAGNYKVIASALAMYINDTNTSGDTPTVAAFNSISDDYITANVGSYGVTSDDGKWYVTYSGTYATATVKKALKTISTDMKWEGLKARIY